MAILRNKRKTGVSCWHQVCRIFKADEAQAMTEYVIVLPVVLLVFFAAVQTMAIAQTVQMVNYAAFASARSYATEYAKFQRDNGLGTDQHTAAQDRAFLVACMALAPVSTGQNPNPGYTTLPDEIPGGFLNLRNVASDDRIPQSVMEGFAVAYTYRVKDFQAQLINGTADSSRATVRVTFNYKLPLLVPGLAEMWNYLETKPGSGNLQEGRFESRWPGNNANANKVGDYTTVLQKWLTFSNAALRTNLENEYTTYGTRSGDDGPPANLNIPAKCDVGFEPLVGEMLP